MQGWIKISPPGSWCTHEALRDAIKTTRPKSFVDIGCGEGEISKLLCSLGMTGAGVDFSPAAIEATGARLADEITAGKFSLVHADANDAQRPNADLAVSCMVMEHVEDDIGFASTMASMVRPGGQVAIFVPGRMDRWTFEDDVAGHLRRYDRKGLKQVLEAAGVESVRVRSVAVPTANMLLGLSDMLVRKAESGKVGLSQRAQTETSGVRDIPWKTVFPPWVKLILNRLTLAPLFWIQRAFYNTDRGIILLAYGVRR